MNDESELMVLNKVRDFIEDALDEKGADVTDSGLDRGYADVGFMFDGKMYAIKVTERPPLAKLKVVE